MMIFDSDFESLYSVEEDFFWDFASIVRLGRCPRYLVSGLKLRSVFGIKMIRVDLKESEKAPE